jgi:hypothetical protein
MSALSVVKLIAVKVRTDKIRQVGVAQRSPTIGPTYGFCPESSNTQIRTLASSLVVAI